MIGVTSMRPSLIWAPRLSRCRGYFEPAVKSNAKKEQSPGFARGTSKWGGVGVERDPAFTSGWMPEIDRPVDAANDDYESVEGRYDDGEWATDVWDNPVRIDKPRCAVVEYDEHGRVVERPRRSIFDRLAL
jgi:hypothetical protein